MTWILLTFLGIFGAHRLYMGKWVTAIIYFFTGGLFLIGVLCTVAERKSQFTENVKGVACAAPFFIVSYICP